MDRRSVLTGMAALAVSGCGSSQPPEAVPERTALTVDLSDLEARQGGRLGIQIAGWNSVSWRPEERFTYCSTFKLFLAAAILERVQRGEEQLDRAVSITDGDMVFHAPVTEPAVGQTLTIEELCNGTVELSDNPAANILIREMGGLQVWQGWYRSIGDSFTRVDRLEPQLNGTGDDRDTTSPAQTARNLSLLLDPSATRLLPAHRDLLMTWLLDTPTGPNRLKAAVPTGWSVAHKTGTSNLGPINDIGVLMPGEGDPLFVAAYYHGPETEDFAAGETILAEAVRRSLSMLGHD